MDLKMTTKTTHYIDWYDLEAELAKLYPLPEGDPDKPYLRPRWELLESPNDTDYSVTAEKNAIKDYDQDDLAEIIETGSVLNYQLGLLMNHLCDEGHVSEGSYVIRISW